MPRVEAIINVPATEHARNGYAEKWRKATERRTFYDPRFEFTKEDIDEFRIYENLLPQGMRTFRMTWDEWKASQKNKQRNSPPKTV